MKFLHVGFHNVLAAEKIVAILYPETSSAKRIREKAREMNLLVDCTMGRKIRSIVLTDSDYSFLSAMRPEALLARLQEKTSESVSENHDE